MKNLNKIQKGSLSLIIVSLIMLVFIGIISYTHTNTENDDLSKRIEARNHSLIVVTDENINNSEYNIKTLKIVVMNSTTTTKTIDASDFLNSIETQNKLDSERTSQQIFYFNVLMMLLSLCLMIFVIALSCLFNQSN
jgi:CHASE3 domain sensor protein